MEAVLNAQLSESATVLQSLHANADKLSNSKIEIVAQGQVNYSYPQEERKCGKLHKQPFVASTSQLNRIHNLFRSGSGGYRYGRFTSSSLSKSAVLRTKNNVIQLDIERASIRCVQPFTGDNWAHILTELATKIYEDDHQAYT